MDKMIKFKDTSNTWKLIDRKEFHKLVKKWKMIRESERLAKAVEERED